MTADTYSSTLGYLVMGTGNDNNTWGGNCNTAVFQIFEDAIANALTSSVTGGTLDLSGSPPPAAASQTRYAALIFSGTLGSAQSVKVPNLRKFWFVQNATAGAFALTLKTPSGSASVAIPQNSGWQLVQCDGADAITVSPFNSKQIQMPDGGATSPEYSNINEPTSGWRRAGTQDWRLMINGLDVLQVTGAGASSPSIVNVLSPNVLQVNGAQVIPAGLEAPCAAIVAPTGWLLEYGQAISRTTYAALFSAITATCTGNTNTSTTLNNLSTDLRNLGLVGAYIEGTGIPTGTTISAIGSATSLTLSQAATATAAGVSIRILPYGQGDASTTFNVPDRRGRVIPGRDDMGGTAALRLTGLTGGVDGTKLSGTGGEQSHTLTAAESAVLTYTSVVTDPSHVHATPQVSSAGGSFGYVGGNQFATQNSPAASTGITVGTTANAGGGAHNNVQPTGISNMIIKT